MNMRKVKHGLQAILLVGLMVSGSAYAEIVLIVNKDNPVEVLSRTELTRIYLGRAKAFPDGGKVHPLNQAADAGVRAELEEGILGKSSSQIHAYWAKQMFSGQAQPPEEVGSDAGMIEKVSSDPNALGYVSSDSVTDAVKVIEVM